MVKSQKLQNQKGIYTFKKGDLHVINLNKENYMRPKDKRQGKLHKHAKSNHAKKEVKVRTNRKIRHLLTTTDINNGRCYKKLISILYEK